ncbi:hypothetical protein GOBAR_AA36576 [Gossypium barbadense]|uniref:Transposase MuDR plant domain-containing protein n=1 Tax=Gossypium barbadense TaxID=3634 RepID=A0A2P5VZ95_GOSBA|nr:hypothetical protein GOBAR_AA36576 [Gossypium barbadense]
MELVDDEDVETIVALYCGTWSNQNAPIQLFTELAGVKETEDPTPLGEEDGAQEPCMVVPVSYVGSQSTIHGIDIDLNAALETVVVGDDEYHSIDPSDHEVDSESDPDVDEVPEDIDDEGMNNEVNVNVPSVGNQIHRIVIHNNPGAHMSQIDPDSVYAAEFPEYPKIQSAHRMAVYSNPEDLFVGQRFEKDHRKLDSKTICTCNMPMVEDMLTIKVSVLIVEMQAQFQYRVSYRKAWIAKQMAMEQLYRDFNASYNEL